MRFNENNITVANFTIKKSQINWVLAITIMFAFVVRLVIAVTYMNKFDTEWYIMWATDMQNGFFSAYDGHVRQLDYPPLYLYCLNIVGMVLKNPVMAEYQPFRMLTIKFFPIVFDVLVVYFIYKIFNKKSPLLALLGAFLWAINPAAIYNCSNWGQTDGIMVLLMLLTFSAFQDKKYILGAVFFGIAITTKLQCLYFAPIILFLYLREKEYKMLFKSLLAGVVTVIAVFLPFMIGSNNYLIAITTYTQGAGTYPYINLNAFNIYGMFDFNWVNDNMSIIGGSLNNEGMLVGGFTFSMLSTIILIASVVATWYIAVYGKRYSIWLNALFFIQCIFMLTTRQHERYQFMVMILALVAFIVEKDFRLLKLFSGLSIIVLLNQFVLLTRNLNTSAPWAVYFKEIQAVCSFINVLLFVYTVYICAIHAFDSSENWGSNRLKGE